MQTTVNPIRPDHYCNLLCLIVLTATVVLSCNVGDEESRNMSGSIPLYSVDNIGSALIELAAEPAGVFEPPGYIGPYYLEPVSKGGFVVTTDRSGNRIHLFDETGTHLAVAGGEGRGPGEFLGAIGLHVGQDNHLYALDLRMHRITRFSLDQNGLNYDTSYSPAYEPGSWLHNIYVTKWGNFGVVRSMVDHSTGEDTFHLYKLDDTFNQAERLFEMSGNEKMSLGEWSHIDHTAGQKTLWDMDGEWFYHISSHSSVINRYNLRTGESMADIYFDLEERKITDETKHQLMEFASNITSRFPDLRKTMEAVTVLPLYEEFLVLDSAIYLVIYDITGSERTEIIRIDKTPEEVRYIDIPIKLWRVQAGNGVIYGIEETEEGSSIRIVKLAE
jgi:hypothetical protein